MTSSGTLLFSIKSKILGLPCALSFGTLSYHILEAYFCDSKHFKGLLMAKVYQAFDLKT